MPCVLLRLLVRLLSADLSLQEKISPQTDFPPTSTSGPSIIPSPTAFNLTKRADSIPENFCGWFTGSGYGTHSIVLYSLNLDDLLIPACSPGERWTYNDPSVTCFWNSDAKFVGDANPPQTACVAQGALSTSSCSGSGCSSSIATCTGSQPYCVTFTYGSDYLSFVCSEKEGIEFQMEPYWSGFSGPIAFPVYTGLKGISAGTQYPAGYPAPANPPMTTAPPQNNAVQNFCLNRRQATRSRRNTTNPN